MNPTQFAEVYRVMSQFAVDPQNPFGLTPNPVSVIPSIPSHVVTTNPQKPGPLEHYLLAGIGFAFAGFMVWRICNQTRELIPIVNAYIGTAYDKKEFYFKSLIDSLSESAN